MNAIRFLKDFLTVQILANDLIKICMQVNELKDALGPLSGRSLQYCSEACLKRYLEARNWNVDKSKKMLEETLRWRSTYKPEEIRWVRELISFFDCL